MCSVSKNLVRIPDDLCLYRGVVLHARLVKRGDPALGLHPTTGFKVSRQMLRYSELIVVLCRSRRNEFLVDFNVTIGELRIFLTAHADVYPAA